MGPAKRDLSVYKGDDYAHDIVLVDADDEPIDLTGFTFLAQIRKNLDSVSEAAEFQVTVQGSPTLGVIIISLTKVQTSALNVGSYVWDIEFTTGGFTSTWLAGVVTVTQDVTHG